MQIPGYTIIKKINAGGMATVFLATQHSVGRTVALKIMKPAFDKDPEFHQRFQREATIIGQLSHPNIIPIYDIGRHEGLNYISMEFLSGGSLDEKIRLGIPLGQALKIAHGIASALEHAHSKGYVHRDIKPENILFRADDSPVLTDFGIARTIKSKSNMTQVGTVVGTPYYMSPEQAMGTPSDGRSDLYSLGVVLYEMLTGEKLFDADSSLAINVKHIHEQPPALPDNLHFMQDILDQLLAKTPEQRFQTAREFLQALAQIDLAAEQNKSSNFKNPLRKILAPLSSANNVAKPTLTPENSATKITSPTAATQAATRVSPTVALQPKPVATQGYPAYLRFGVYFFLLLVLAIIGWTLFSNEQKPSAQEQWAKLSNSPREELIPLTIKPIPQDARVRILNIRDKYFPGILLPAGTYQLEISHSGYNTRKKWIRLSPNNSTIDIALQKNNQTIPSNQLPLPELVFISSGSFLMGNPNTQHAIPTTLENDFYVSRYEVTFNEYDYFAVETNRALPDDNGWGRGERPVINISWDDAIAYINWLNKTTGKTYRLPTAAEWEYVARGNTTSSYWWGNNPQDARERANCRIGCKNWWDSFFDNKTQVVGAFPPNDFGVHDTSGNVAEWINDCADKTETNINQSTPCLKRGARGGSFTSKVDNIAAYSQTAVIATKSRKNLGFRVVQEIPQIRVLEEQPNTTSQPRRRNIFRELRDSIFKRDN